MSARERRLPPFAQLYGTRPRFTTEAPGRINLVGEHTGYNSGLVLPCALPQRTTVELFPRTSRDVRVSSSNIHVEREATYQLGRENLRSSWVDVVQAVTSVLLAQNYEINGFDARIESLVPSSLGLASSSALSVALLLALDAAFELGLTRLDVARLAQQAENGFLGVRMGVMDPMACALSVHEHVALFIDTSTLAHQLAPLPADVDLGVVHSGLPKRSLLTGYSARRQECEQAASLLDVSSLREVAVNDPRLARLPEVLAKRVRHVSSENERVREALAAITIGDGAKLGAIFDASNASLRDDYEVSTPALDGLVRLVRSQPGCLGARATSVAYGGSVVFVAEAGRALTVANDAAAAYANATNERPQVIVPISDRRLSEGSRFKTTS